MASCYDGTSPDQDMPRCVASRTPPGRWAPPSRQNLQRIEQAYRTVRRENIARYLLARLNREGRGTRVEIHPLNQSHVVRPRQRVVEFRTLNIRNWDRIVQAWVSGDDRAWMMRGWTRLLIWARSGGSTSTSPTSASLPGTHPRTAGDCLAGPRDVFVCSAFVLARLLPFRVLLASAVPAGACAVCRSGLCAVLGLAGLCGCCAVSVRQMVGLSVWAVCAPVRPPGQAVLGFLGEDQLQGGDGQGEGQAEHP